METRGGERGGGLTSPSPVRLHLGPLHPPPSFHLLWPPRHWLVPTSLCVCLFLFLFCVIALHVESCCGQAFFHGQSWRAKGNAAGERTTA